MLVWGPQKKNKRKVSNFLNPSTRIFDQVSKYSTRYIPERRYIPEYTSFITSESSFSQRYQLVAQIYIKHRSIRHFRTSIARSSVTFGEKKFGDFWRKDPEMSSKWK